jgi:opacity protein-like surface antigen
MMARMILAAGTLGTLLSSSAFAQDAGISTTASAPKMSVQAQVEVLPVGSASSSSDGTTSSDAAVAYGITGAFDYAVTPYLSVGVAPRFVLNVTADNAEPGTKTSQEIDLRARLLAHFPVAQDLEVYASVMPGYTIVTSPVDEISSATGFAIGGAAGLTYNISPKLFVNGEVGYQRAFTSFDIKIADQTFHQDMDLSYMHVGLGAGTRF